MAEMRIDNEELKNLVQKIVGETLQELDQFRLLTNGKLALAEPEAAALLDLNPWQLRDLRLQGKIGFSRIVGGKVRYVVADLLAYLRRTREKGTRDE